jgi:hypothetical protein
MQSIVHALEYARVIYYKTESLPQRDQEIKDVLDKILRDIGVIVQKGRFTYVVNTDYYEQFISMFWRYCDGNLSNKQFLSFISDLYLVSKAN